LGVSACSFARGRQRIGIISDESKRDYVLSLGAKGSSTARIQMLGQCQVNTPEYNE